MSDIEVINTELALADLDSVDKQLAKYEKVAQAGGDKEAQRLVSALKKVREGSECGPAGAQRGALQRGTRRARAALPADHEADDVRGQHRRARLQNELLLEKVQAHAAKEGAPVVPVSAALEAQIADMPSEDKKLSPRGHGHGRAGLNRVIRAAYKLLGLQTYFTAGPKEARAWTVPPGATAPQAAGVIHTDFERGFIRAEVASYDDFVACGGEQGAKEAGKLRLEGRDYRVRDGDVIHFRFNV